MNHLMRSARHDGAEDACQALSLALREATEDVVGAALNPMQWEQATLPISAGGMCIRDPVTEWPAARLAALIVFQQKAGDTVGAPLTAFAMHAPDWVVTLAAVQSQLGSGHEPFTNWATNVRGPLSRRSEIYQASLVDD